MYQQQEIVTNTSMHRKTKTTGFTLLEVLLAMMIFATLSLAANQIFRNVITSNEQSQEVGNALSNLQRTLFIMDSDFRQVLSRRYRDGGDTSHAPILAFQNGFLDSSSQGIRFVRGGWTNPQALLPRGDVVRVGYRTVDDELQRIRWMYPDDSVSTEPAEMTLLKGVKSIRFAIFENNSWKDTWDQPDSTPSAIRITLETERYGELERIYILPNSTKAEVTE